MRSVSRNHIAAAEARENGRKRALPVAREIQVHIIQFLHEHGPATDETIAAGIGLKLATVRRRRAELVRAGVVTQTDTGLWQAVPPLSSTCPPANGQAADEAVSELLPETSPIDADRPREGHTQPFPTTNAIDDLCTR